MRWFMLSLLLLGLIEVKAQDSTNFDRHLVFGLGIAPSRGQGEFGDKFRSFSSIPVTALYKTKKNYTIGLMGSGYFGQDITVPGLFEGMDHNGFLIDINGNPAAVRFQMRGFYTIATVGKIFSLKRPNPNKGIHVKVGAGFMQHKLRMQFDSDKVPQLEDEYVKGYDQLHNGAMLMASIQYHVIAMRNLSFYAGFDYVQGYTKNRRSWNYFQNKKDDKLKTDQYFSFSAGILIPLKIYKAAEARYFE